MKTQPFQNLLSNKFNLIKPFFKATRTRELSNVDTIVLHWTAGASIDNDVRTLKSKNYGYHFLIDRDGTVFQGSPINKVVSHAGLSYGPRGIEVNSHSIGISFSTLGTLDKDEFSDEMYNSCIQLVKDIKLGVPSVKYITGHHWVSPGRKIDPWSFDFTRLLNALGPESGLEIWKTGYLPFPKNLRGCKCVKTDSKGNCLESVGKCQSSKGERYSERDVTKKANSLTFSSDLETP